MEWIDCKQIPIRIFFSGAKFPAVEPMFFQFFIVAQSLNEIGNIIIKQLIKMQSVFNLKLDYYSRGWFETCVCTLVQGCERTKNSNVGTKKQCSSALSQLYESFKFFKKEGQFEELRKRRKSFF